MGKVVRNEIKGDGRAKGNGIGVEERRDMSIQEREGDTSGIVSEDAWVGVGGHAKQGVEGV